MDTGTVTGQASDQTAPDRTPRGRKEGPGRGWKEASLSGSSSIGLREGSRVLPATSGPSGGHHLPGSFYPDVRSPAQGRRSAFSLEPHAVQPACTQNARPPHPPGCCLSLFQEQGAS